MNATWQEPIAAAFRGRIVVLIELSATVAAERAAKLRALGCLDVLPVCAGTTAPETSGNESGMIVLGLNGDAVEVLALLPELLMRPPAQVREWLRSRDPDAGALVLLPPAVRWRDGTVWGRSVFGHRPEAWEKWEDKTFSVAHLARIAPTRTAYRVCSTELKNLQESARSVLCEQAGLGATPRVDGTVWSADASIVLTGMSAGSRWVRTKNDETAAAAELRRVGPTCRVMPFVEGVPWSIHAVVGMAGDVAVGRPVEILTLRRPEAPRLLWVGNSTTWRPGRLIEEQSEQLAYAVARQLIEKVDYRGAFSVDGVATPTGLVPTEINTRVAGGLVRQGRGIPGLDLRLLHHVLVHGSATSFHARLLQYALSAAPRSGAATLPLYKSVPAALVTPEIAEHLRTKHGLIAELRPTMGLVLHDDPSWAEHGTALGPRVARVTNTLIDAGIPVPVLTAGEP